VKHEVSKRARRNIERIQAWWVENRPAAASLFLDELAEAEQLLRTSPECGVIYATHRTGVVRRLVLGKTSHQLYYRYRPECGELVVLTVWGGPRAREPKL
jgi:plasmid stabilization system protein ParE